MQPQLNLIMIRARDIDKLAEFYGFLGLQLKKEKHSRGPEHYSCSFGETVFEIYPVGAGEEHTRGAWLGFQVQSLDQVMTALSEHNATVLSEPGPTPWGRSAVIKDPEGHTIMLFDADAS